MRKLLPRSPRQDIAPEPPSRAKRTQVQTACEACRKRKIKCDNRRPECSQCVLSGKECYFPASRNRAGQEELAHKLQAVSETESSLRMILDLLREGPETQSTQLLRNIQAASSINDFVESFSDASLLLNHALLPSTLSSLPAENIQVYSPSSVASRLPETQEPFAVADDIVAKFPHGILPLSQWTSLSMDDRYLTHLLALFATWDNTLSNIVFRSTFLKDLQLGPAEPRKFCSSFLVHSIIAVSHLYISQGASLPHVKELRSNGRVFADEALRILSNERQHPSITLVQGLALLWTYEVNYGNKVQAVALLDEFYYVHGNLGLSDIEIPGTDGAQAPQDPQLAAEWQVISSIVWAIFCLEAKLSLSLSRAMRIKRPRILKSFESAYLSLFASHDAPENSWSPYPDDCWPQQSLFREVFTLECQLAELIQEASWFFAPTEHKSSVQSYDEINAIYEKLLRWGACTSRGFLTNNSLLPSLLFLNVTYEMALLKLLSCLCRFHIQDRIHESAESTQASYGASVISNLWVYRAVYGIRHEYWLMQACQAAVIPVVVRLGADLSMSKPVMMACQLLYSIGEFLPVANESLWSVKDLAHRHAVSLPKDCRTLYSRLAVRTGRITLRDVVIPNLGSGDGSLATEASRSSYKDVTFAVQIEDICDATERGGGGDLNDQI
ncbi:hypothetical protein J3F84DRAFT_374608 [Trichoderma pleuroticola]